MAIVSQRFNYLDKETNIGIKDFTKLTDNAVYNTVDQIVDSAINNIQDSKSTLNALQGNMKELIKMLDNEEINAKITEALNSAIDSISNMELPEAAKDILASVKKLDSIGLRDFFKDILNIGSSFLCNNLDFLKLFMLGYALNKNIVSGLLIALLLSWLDRYCKEFTQEEIKKANNKSKLDKMFPPKGVIVEANNAFNLFTNYYSDYLKANEPLQLQTPLATTDFLNNIINGDIDSSIDNLRNSEIDSFTKMQYINILDANLANYPPYTNEYRNILTARGKLKTVPLISNNRRNRNIRYENLSEKLGTYIKNLSKLGDLPINNFVNLSAIEKTLYEKMVSLKNSAVSDVVLQSTPNNSFRNYNFTNILPNITPEEISYLNSRNVESDSHRLYDLHPTTTVFLQEA